MVRTKSVSKGFKTKRSHRGQSSRTAELRGPYGIRFTGSAQQDRFQVLATRPMEPSRRYDWSLFMQLGLEEAFHQLLLAMGWHQLARIEEETYRHFVLEFLSSIKLEEGPASETLTMTFRLKNKEAAMSVEEVNELFGFPNEGFKKAEHCPGFFPNVAWFDLTGKEDDFKKHSKVSSIRTPLLRLVHRFITFTLRARGESSSWVSKEDLFLLWCVHQRERVNGGWWLMQRFAQIAQRPSGIINIGQFVSAIARAVGVDITNADKQHLLHFVESKHMVGTTMLSNLNIIRKLPRPDLGRRRFTWEVVLDDDAPAATEEDEDTAEATADMSADDEGEAEGDEARDEGHIGTSSPPPARKRARTTPSTSVHSDSITLTQIWAELQCLRRDMDLVKAALHITPRDSSPIDPPLPPEPCPSDPPLPPEMSPTDPAPPPGPPPET